MAFVQNNLSVLSYANGFTLWHYKTSDNISDVDSQSYFDTAHRILRVGDFMMVNAGIGGSAIHGVMVVVGNADGVVDVSNVSPFGTINSD